MAKLRVERSGSGAHEALREAGLNRGAVETGGKNLQGIEAGRGRNQKPRVRQNLSPPFVFDAVDVQERTDKFFGNREDA